MNFILHRLNTKLIILLAILGIAASEIKLNAQIDEDLVAIADEMYNFGDVIDALEQYKQAASINPQNKRAQLMTGVCYLESIHKDRSLKYLLKAYELDPKIREDIIYLIAQAYHFNENTIKAKEFYNNYKSVIDEMDLKGKEKKEKKALMDHKIGQCNNLVEFKKEPVYVSIESLGEEINTIYPDYAPAINSDEDLMIFTSRRSGGMSPNKDNDNLYFEDIYITRKESGEWQEPKNLGLPVNTEFHDASIGLSPDGKKMFMYKDAGNGDIYVSEFDEENEDWKEPENMGRNINSLYSETSVTISNDGQTLIFASKRPKGEGGFDLYISKKDKDGEWDKPDNLGETVNTEYDEDSPFLSFDGKYLFFSSNGHKGMGGFDIFRSEWNEKKEEWGEPVNLGYPINTVDDDIYYIQTTDPDIAYYASIKESGVGEKDIFKLDFSPDNEEIVEEDTLEETPIEEDTTFTADAEPVDTLENIEPDESESEPDIALKEAEEEPTPVTILINVENEAGNPMDARVRITEKGTSTTMQLTQTGTGTYEINLTPTSERDYDLSIEESGYFFINTSLTVPKAEPELQEINKTLVLKELEEETPRVLRNIYFDFDQVTLKESSYAELQKVQRMMEDNPGQKLEIMGHTDKVGSKSYNQQLSQKRAQAVVNYLVKSGIDPSRLIAKGYGETRPLASNDDELEGRELNRRTEFKIIK